MIGVSSILFIVLGFVLLTQFKSILLKLTLFIYWYPLITMYLFCIDYPLGGSIDILGRPINEIFSESALIYAIVGYYCFVGVIWKLRDHKFEYERIEFTESMRFFIALLLLITSVLAYPKAFGLAEQRWNLIAGPWLVISISLNTILFLSFEKLKSLSSIIQILTAVLLIAGGERVNSLTTVLLFFILQTNTDSEIIKEKKLNLSLIIFGSLAVVTAIGAHYWRNGEAFKLLLLYQNIVSSSTVGDVTHIYFSSFTYLNEKGVEIGPVLNEIGSLLYLPGIGGTGENVVYNFTEILREYVYNYGGGLFYTEGVLIFGRLGVPIYAIFYGLFIRILFRYKNHYMSIIAIVFFVLQFRIQWYGFVYIYTPIWFSIVMLKFLNVIKRQQSYFTIIEE